MIFLDIETLDFFGDAHIKSLPRSQQLMKIKFGLAITFDSNSCQWREWWDEQIVELWEYLRGKTIIGWNINNFDIPIIQNAANAAGYPDAGMDPIDSLDMMDYLRRETGRYYKLDLIALTNLGYGKTGDGQAASEQLRSCDPTAHRMAAEYCKNDVRLLLDLYSHGKLHGLLCPARPERGEEGDLRIWL